MRRIAGQAARHTGRLLHGIVQLAVGIVVAAAVLISLLSWRLSQGPLELNWLAERLQAAVNADGPTQLSLGSASLAWEGFRRGVDRPLDIRLADATVTDGDGNRIASVPSAALSLSVGWLLLGRVVPRALQVDGAELRVVRAADGTVQLDLGSLPDSVDAATGEQASAGSEAATGPGGSLTHLLREFAQPATGDHGGNRMSHWSQLRRVRIRDARIAVVDRMLHAKWQALALNIDLTRGREGGVAGTGNATLAIGGQTADLTIVAALRGTTGETSITANLSQVMPSTLAAFAPEAAKLTALDAPVVLSASAELDADLQPTNLSARAEIGAGTIRLGSATTTLRGATLQAAGLPARMYIDVPRLELAARPDGPTTHIQARADVSRDATGVLRADAALDMDVMAFADLPQFWPEGIGGPGARPWITQNITDGTLRNGHVEISLATPADLSDVTVTRLVGGIDGENATVHWLRPVPPIDQASAHLSITGTDALEITLTGGRQAGGTQGGLRVRGGKIVFTGFNEPDQFADIDADLAGSVVDLLNLLRLPKVGLLDRTKLDLHDASGQLTGKVSVAKLPLRDKITMDDVNLRASTKLSGFHLGGIVAGRDLDRGDIALDVNPDGLHAAGGASVAGIPAQLQLDMDFRSGPPEQVLEKVAVSGSLDTKALAALGADPGRFMTGYATISVALEQHRDGHGIATLGADLGAAKLALAELGFTKPAGEAASLSADMQLDGQRIAGIDKIDLSGDGLHVEGAADFADGRPDVLRLTRLSIGSTIDAHGEIRVPRRAGDPWRVKAAGASFDATAELDQKPGPSAPTPAKEPPPGPPWTLDATFDRVVLSEGREVTAVDGQIENDGRVTRHARISARTGAAAPFQVVIEPQGNGRRLTATTADAGGLLRAFNVLDTMQGGNLTLIGTYDDSRPDHPLIGNALIDNFRIHKAPVLAKLLQAMTLYGLVDAMSGPGLNFTQLAAPFRLASDTLDLVDARVFSSSLGMTAKGRVDLDRQTIDMQGTIVPAYIINSALGNIPLVGRLFSPERGGGVFAASYTVHGGIDDPTVSINALSALTPGFLRGLFGIFDDSTVKQR